MRCKFCHYPLAGLAGTRCPECGHGFDPENPDTFESPSLDFLFQPRWLALLIIVTIFPLVWALVMITFLPAHGPWRGVIAVAPLWVLAAVNVCWSKKRNSRRH